jgi:hypothetical protein
MLGDRTVKNKFITALGVVFAAIVLCVGLRVDKALAVGTCTLAGFDQHGSLINTYIACSGGGGGSTVVVSEPLTATPTDSPSGGTLLGFDYSSPGDFTSIQQFSAGASFDSTVASMLCTGLSPSVGAQWAASSFTGFLAGIDTTPTFTLQQCISRTVRYVPLLIHEGVGFEIDDAHYPFTLLNEVGNNGCASFSSGVLGSTGSPCSGTSYTPGPNITFEPGSPVAIGLASTPILAGLEFTPSPAFSPGTLAGFTSAGDGNSELVSVSVSPCPTAGGCVVSVSGNAPVSCAGVAIVTCTAATPSPTAVGNIAWSGSWPYTATVATPSPQATGCAIISGSFPYKVDSTGCQASGVPSPYPTPITTTGPSPNPISVTTTTVGGASVATLAFNLLGPSLGGLGIDGTTFSNGQCPAWNSGAGHFSAAACSSTTYTAGTNMSLSGGAFSTIATPRFTTLNLSAPSAAESCLIVQYDDPLSGCTGNAPFVGIYAGANLAELEFNDGIDCNMNTNAVAYLADNCITHFTAALTMSAGMTSNAINDSSLSVNQTVCTDGSKNLQSCGGVAPVAEIVARGNGTCTISGVSCSQSIAVPSTTANCQVTFHGDQPSQSTIPISLNQNVSGTTLVVKVYYGSTPGSVAVTYQYQCTN